MYNLIITPSFVSKAKLLYLLNEKQKFMLSVVNGGTLRFKETTLLYLTISIFEQFQVFDVIGNVRVFAIANPEH